MATNSPSQFECDNAERGDLVVIKARPFWYKWYRDRFLKDKIKIKIRKNWDSEDREEVYQEDCVLLYRWELEGKSEFDNTVPYYLGYNNKYIMNGKILQLLQVGTENVSIVLKGGLSILIPASYFRNAVYKMDATRENVDEQRQIQQQLKYAKYKGEFFKSRSKELGITEWNVTYCPICGNPVKIIFDGDTPRIDNTCDCGNMLIKNENISYDTVAYWFYGQTQPTIVERYKKFWKI